MELLILKSLEGGASPQEEATLLEWRRHSAANEQLYRELARLWAALPDVSQALPGAPPDPRALLARARLRTFPSSEGPSRDATRRWAGLAAAVVAVLAIASIPFWDPDRSEQEFGPDQFVTGSAGASTVTLRDGTVMRLGPDTRVRVTGRGPEREVTLSGRAFFAVAHAPGRPFRILTSAGTVTALGTRFELETREEDLSVVLIEGRVVVSTPGREVTLEPGEAARVIGGTTLPVVKVSDVHRTLGWVGNFLAFQSTPLADVVREIEDRFDVHVELADPGLATRAVTAWFEDASVEEVLRIVCAATLVTCSRERGVVVMRSQEDVRSTPR